MGEGRGEDFGDGGKGGEQGGNGGEAVPKSRLCTDVQDCDGSGIKKTQHFEDKISQTEDFICQCRCLQLSHQTTTSTSSTRRTKPQHVEL